MKQLKFSPELVPLVVSGSKTSTWRLFDDKDLRLGDRIELCDRGSGKVFAKALLTEVVSKTFESLTENDWDGHESYDSEDGVYRAYSKYYDRPVGPNTDIKIIRFKLLSTQKPPEGGR